jgi:hypothetical protein
MSHAYAYQETAEERARVDAALAKMGVSRSTRASADVVPIDRAKKPLGLGIILDDNERAAERDDDDPTGGWRGWHFGKDKDRAFLESAVSFAWLFHFLDLAGGALLGVHNDGVREVNDLWDDVQREIKKSEAAQRAEQRVEVAELKATIAELKAEVTSLRAVQEGQRIASRGERGEQGVRGIPGPPGPVGAAGPQGARGDAAAMIVGWEPRVERFELVPILGDGTRGVSAHLLPFFEQYDATIRDDGDGEG